MFLRRIFKGIPDMGRWLSVAELLAALATVVGVLIGLNVVPNPFAGKVATGTIAGAVSDVATGKPVPEATVQVIDNTARVMVCEKAPDAKGNFEAPIKPGAYTASAVCDGYGPCSKSVSVLENQRRVVNLAIKRLTAAEAKAEATHAASQPQTRIVTVPVVVPSGGDGRNLSPRPSSRPAAVEQATASEKTSKEALVTERLTQASQLLGNGKSDEAEQVCLAAQKIYPTDGRIYASLITISVDGQSNTVQAKDYAAEGKRKVKKHKDKLQSAIATYLSE